MMSETHRRAGAGISGRLVFLAATCAVFSALVPARAIAQQSTLPPVTVTAPKTKEVDQPARIGGDAAKGGAGAKGDGKGQFDRLNQELKRKADETNPTANSPPLDARSPDTKTGVVNIPGVQQQYGPNFGHSVVPYRPPPLIYTSPLAPHR